MPVLRPQAVAQVQYILRDSPFLAKTSVQPPPSWQNPFPECFKLFTSQQCLSAVQTASPPKSASEEKDEGVPVSDLKVLKVPSS